MCVCVWICSSRLPQGVPDMGACPLGELQVPLNKEPSFCRDLLLLGLPPQSPRCWHYRYVPPLTGLFIYPFLHPFFTHSFLLRQDG